jgi:multicomponent Na+:H+ antiporter subunit D
MSEVSSFFHPAIAFLALGLAMPFFRGGWNYWKWLLLVPPIVAIVAVISADYGTFGVIEYMDFQLTLGRVDRLSIVFAHVFAIQALIGFVYGLHLKDRASQAAAAFYVAGAFGCVFAGDYLTIFIFWEIQSVASTMLIWLNRNPVSTRAGFRYFLFHTLGGLLLLGGILLRYKATGSFAFTAVGYDTAQYYDWLIMLGFGVNAGFIVLHAWLPDAYPNATITGAVFMSAFTTKTAVYVLARGFAGWDFVAIMGTVMAVYGVIYATMENNARRILSYHIISQVGYMVAGIGIGTAMTINGAAAHAYAHILYKGLLFMSVGALFYATGTQKLTKLGGLAGRLPIVMLCYMVAAVSISGWPLFNGFISKNMTIAGAFADHRMLLGLGLEIASVGTFLSVGIKLPYFAFFAKPDDTKRKLQPIPLNMYIAMFMGAFLCIFQGVYPQALYSLLPYEVSYVPYNPWQVFASLMLLSFTGLAFYLMRRIMKPHAQRNIDFEIIYVLVGKAFYNFICRPLQWLDNIWTEVYRIIGLRWLIGIAKGTVFFDQKGIDTVVDGTAYTVRGVGRGAAVTETGRIQDYLAGAVVVALVVFGLVWYLS